MDNREKIIALSNELAENFRNDVRNTKRDQKKTFLACSLDWDFNVHRFLKSHKEPHLRTFLKFNFHSGNCPVKKMIIYLKDYIEPYELISFICKLFNINNVRFE